MKNELLNKTVYLSILKKCIISTFLSGIFFWYVSPLLIPSFIAGEIISLLNIFLLSKGALLILGSGGEKINPSALAILNLGKFLIVICLGYFFLVTLKLSVTGIFAGVTLSLLIIFYEFGFRISKERVFD